MAGTMTTEQLRELARLGAKAMLDEIAAEFPELVWEKREGPRRVNGAAKRPRRAMTAKEKAAVSKRMRKYWAARRKAKGAK